MTTSQKAASRSKSPKSTTPRTAKPDTAKAAESAATATEADAVVSEPEMKKQELLAKVVERSDVKKKFAKPVVEAVLDVLGEALADGRELNLQPFGKLKYNRTKETANARILVTKIRQSKSAAPTLTPEKETVAEAAE